MPQNNNLDINYEDNVLFLEIEHNDFFDESKLTDEERENIKKKNEELTKKFITPNLLEKVDVCGCQMAEFTKKQMARSKLLYGTNQVQAGILDQEDVDKFMFSVIVSTNNNLMDPEPLFIGRACKYCHKLEAWGDLDVITRIVAESTANKITNQTQSFYDNINKENNENNNDSPTDINPDSISEVISEAMDGNLGPAGLLGGLASGLMGNMFNNISKPEEIVQEQEEEVENTEPAE